MARRPSTYRKKGAAERWLATGHPLTNLCVEWPFSTRPNGYGRIYISGQTYPVHRLVCEQEHGPAPTEKHEVAHSCGNKLCYNPRHLRWATRTENALDKRAHGRAKGNTKNHTGEPVADAVVRYCKRSSESGVSLAKKFGISHSSISMWRRGLVRGDIT